MWMQPVDQYPRGRAMLADEDYARILRDLLNLSNILDDMELSGTIPYHSRTPYYAQYSRLYRMVSGGRPRMLVRPTVDGAQQLACVHAGLQLPCCDEGGRV